ncbi:methyltransferase domain-containing protein [Actinomadura sp. ATCC 31491]|uniref:Protein-L-isoaspartate O-methyltransferase n=1 Tax=Actinomadura luzonensis TaxID=2805427 RepID=A0ABT0FR62_9ACTN|nr:methyltransferase domain-containing protein [Actinomadura luzonensis]MCK2214810.1 methyltransferase domain-containing protein [Actinomadura luzonensis]
MDADRLLAAAVDAVPRAHYTDHPELGAPPQTSPPKVVQRDLARAGAGLRGARVLEIGTGTGYTGALLAQLVGPAGLVVSVDVDGRLVERARRLHAERRCPVTVVCGDGHDGVPDHAPYDLVIGWCAPALLPDAWLKQTRPGGIVSTPVYVAPAARAVGHVRAEVTGDGGLTGVRLATASYVDMGDAANVTLGAPLLHLDATCGPSYVSVAWRGRAGGEPAAALALLDRPGHAEPHPVGLHGEQAAAAWHTRALRRRPRPRARRGRVQHGAAARRRESASASPAAGTPPWSPAPGAAGRHPGSAALAALREHLRAWDAAGRPGLDRLAAEVTPADGGRRVQVTLPPGAA